MAVFYHNVDSTFVRTFCFVLVGCIIKMAGEVSMTVSVEKILRFSDLGIEREHEYCVVTRCDKPATRWITSRVDGKLIPACEKHYHDPKMTPRRWENARKKYEAEVRSLIGKKCYWCGGQAEGTVDLNSDAAFEKYGNEWLDNDDLWKEYIPKIVWECKACALARLDD